MSSYLHTRCGGHEKIIACFFLCDGISASRDRVAALSISHRGICRALLQFVQDAHGGNWSRPI